MGVSVGDQAAAAVLMRGWWCGRTQADGMESHLVVCLTDRAQQLPERHPSGQRIDSLLSPARVCLKRQYIGRHLADLSVVGVGVGDQAAAAVASLRFLQV